MAPSSPYPQRSDLLMGARNPPPGGLQNFPQSQPQVGFKNFGLYSRAKNYTKILNSGFRFR